MEHAHTSQRCAACGVVDKKSRNGESFVCVSCGWCHHADKNAAKNILDNDCLHTEETGGQAHGNRGGTIAGVEVVTRREDHGSDGSGMNNSTGRLGPDNDDDNIGRSDRAPERASGHATERSVCTNFRSPLYHPRMPTPYNSKTGGSCSLDWKMNETLCPLLLRTRSHVRSPQHSRLFLARACAFFASSCLPSLASESALPL